MESPLIEQPLRDKDNWGLGEFWVWQKEAEEANQCLRTYMCTLPVA